MNYRPIAGAIKLAVVSVHVDDVAVSERNHTLTTL